VRDDLPPPLTVDTSLVLPSEALRRLHCAMSAEKATYLDASAVVRLAVHEPESPALRRFLRRPRPLVTSALARTEVARALLPFGATALGRGVDVLRRIEIIRISDRILAAAGKMPPLELRSLDAIHLATAQQLGDDLGRLCTYDDRMAEAARAMGWAVVTPK